MLRKHRFLCIFLCFVLLVCSMPVYAAESLVPNAGMSIPVVPADSDTPDDSNPEPSGGTEIEPAQKDAIAKIADADPAPTEIPYAEFTNVSNDTPDLFVRKTVFSAVPEIEAPDADFFFTIKVNGEYYDKQEYFVYDVNSKPVLNYAEVNGTQVEIPFETDRNGGFSLKAGQTAKFPWIGKDVEYEIIEENLPEGFVQTLPVGEGPAIGNVGATGSTAVFENTYYPENPKKATTELEIVKNVLLPDGYDIPDTPDFHFEVYIGGESYAHEPYSISQNGEEISSGMTGDNGEFTMKGGQVASFQDVPANKDYEVRETDIPEGWRQSNANSSQGVTVAPLTHVDFTNAIASFAVTKHLDDYSIPETEFTFMLMSQLQMGESDVPMPMIQAKYYLYDSNQQLVDSELHLTNEAGMFSLQAGQTALFIGVEPGTTFTVQEIAQSGYKQVTPEAVEGYTKTVYDNAVTVLEFVNAPEKEASLTILKVNEEDTPLENVKFKLMLGQEADENSQYAVLEQDGEFYRITKYSKTGTEVSTDAQGKIYIRGLETGTYSLVETEPVEGYEAPENIVFDVNILTDEAGNTTDMTLQLNAVNADRSDVELSGSMKDGTGTLTLTNFVPRTELPNTGGSGTFWFGFFGLILCVLGISLCVRGEKVE